MSSSQQCQDGPGRLVSSYAAPSESGPPTDSGPSTHSGPSTTTASTTTSTTSATTIHTGFTHPRHPHCPDSLNCLADTNDKPNHILPVIVRGAILGSAMRKLTLRGIYAAIEEKWPYYRTAPPGWKDSIRHNLSLNRLFKKVPRPGTEAGHGSYWTVDLYAPPGSKRPRKRRTPGQAAAAAANPHRRNYATSGDVGAVIMPPFRLGDAAEDDSAFSSANANANPVAAVAAASRESHSESEPDDGGPEYIPSDCESEEPAAGPTAPAVASTANPASDARGASNPEAKLAGGGSNESDKERVPRLEEQLRESQRQFSVASAFSLRLTQQLEAAQDEARRAHAKLAGVREQLEEELVARMAVERRLEAEEGRRREAEGRVREMVRVGGGGQGRLVDAMRSIRDISSKALDLES